MKETTASTTVRMKQTTFRMMDSSAKSERTCAAFLAQETAKADAAWTRGQRRRLDNSDVPRSHIEDEDEIKCRVYGTFEEGNDNARSMSQARSDGEIKNASRTPTTKRQTAHARVDPCRRRSGARQTRVAAVSRRWAPCVLWQPLRWRACWEGAADDVQILLGRHLCYVTRRSLHSAADRRHRLLRSEYHLTPVYLFFRTRFKKKSQMYTLINSQVLPAVCGALKLLFQSFRASQLHSTRSILSLGVSSPPTEVIVASRPTKAAAMNRQSQRSAAGQRNSALLWPWCEELEKPTQHQTLGSTSQLVPSVTVDGDERISSSLILTTTFESSITTSVTHPTRSQGVCVGEGMGTGEGEACVHEGVYESACSCCGCAAWCFCVRQVLAHARAVARQERNDGRNVAYAKHLHRQGQDSRIRQGSGPSHKKRRRMSLSTWRQEHGPKWC